jgi:hypothetical protein
MQVIQPRSTLSDLAPIGTGTTHAESMDGYLLRLARDHHVPVRAMKAFILYGEGTAVSGALAQRADGPTVTSQRIAVKLPSLTLQSDAAKLGFAGLAGRLSPTFAFKTSRAWCPDCVQEMVGRTPYWPLAWGLLEYSHCARHRCVLVTTCPECEPNANHLGDLLPQEVGCPRCRIEFSVDAQKIHQRRYRTYCTGEALSACLEDLCMRASEIPLLVTEERSHCVDRTIRHVMKQGVVRNDQELAALVGLTPQFLDRLRGGTSARPTLCVLSRLSILSGVPIVGILHQPLWEPTGVGVSAEQLQTLPLSRGGEQRDYSQLQNVARTLAKSGEIKSLAYAAQDLGMGIATMRAALGSELMSELRDSAKRKRQADAGRLFEELVSTIAETCRHLRSEGAKISAARVGRELRRFSEHPLFMRAYRKALSA